MNKIEEKIKNQRKDHENYEKKLKEVSEYAYEISKKHNLNTPCTHSHGSTLIIELFYNNMNEDFKHILLTYNCLKSLSEMCDSTDINIDMEYDGRCCSNCGIDPNFLVRIIIKGV